MLVQARRRKLDGVDAVIGVVETHGRVETDLLTKGIETVPKKRTPYKGRVLAEMDLDAILQRRPRLVLVDELAHDNAPGSRHPKRYMDVEELLAAGIDVYTTLNVQHVESLNDVVAKITKVRVRETVPDSILDRADDIELVDLTPEDLLQRLKDGKVYLPEAAERAAQNYFVPGNLAALRELALRRTAQRVDAQTAIRPSRFGRWRAGELHLVCIGPNPLRRPDTPGNLAASSPDIPTRLRSCSACCTGKVGPDPGLPAPCGRTGCRNGHAIGPGDEQCGFWSTLAKKSDQNRAWQADATAGGAGCSDPVVRTRSCVKRVTSTFICLHATGKPARRTCRTLSLLIRSRAYLGLQERGGEGGKTALSRLFVEHGTTALITSSRCSRSDVSSW